MMRTQLFLATSVVASLATASFPALAADLYFDSVAGDDSKDGSSEATAKKTLKLSGSGNTVHLKRGSSWTMSLNASSVTVTTYGEGARPVINGTATVSKAVVEGIAIKIPTGGTRAVNGFNVNGDSTVSDCEVDGTGAMANVGFGIMGQNNKIIGNYVHDLGWSQSGGSMDNSGGAEGYMVMASNNEVGFNSAVNCQSVNATLGGNEGGCLEIVNGKAGSTISNVSFHHNYCDKSVGLWEGCSGDFSASGGGIQENHGIIENATVSYNLSIDSMWIYLLQPVNTDFKNVVFANNTIVHTPMSAEFWDSGGGHFMMALAVADYTNNATGTKYTTDNEYYKKSGGFQPGTIIVKNNIFVDNISSSRNMMFMSDLSDHSNNLFVPANAQPGSLTLNSTEKKVDLADLAFNSTDRADCPDNCYRLTAKSAAAIDQGVAVGMSGNGSLAVVPLESAFFESTFNQDIDRKKVPCGSAPDIGASEYCADDETTIVGTGGGTSSSSSAKGGSSSTTAAANGSSSTGAASGSTKGGSTSKSTTASTKGGSTSAAATGNSSAAEGGAAAVGSGDTTDIEEGGAANDSSTPSSTKASGSGSSASGSSKDATDSGDDSTSTDGSQGTATDKGSSAAGGAGAAQTATGSTVAAPEVGGCTCRVQGQDSRSTRAGMALMALLAGVLLRRRRQQRA